MDDMMGAMAMGGSGHGSMQGMSGMSGMQGMAGMDHGAMPGMTDPAPPVVRHARTEYGPGVDMRSEEHTSELQSLMRISYAVFCLTKKTIQLIIHSTPTI